MSIGANRVRLRRRAGVMVLHGLRAFPDVVEGAFRIGDGMLGYDLAFNTPAGTEGLVVRANVTLGADAAASLRILEAPAEPMQLAIRILSMLGTCSSGGSRSGGPSPPAVCRRAGSMAGVALKRSRARGCSGDSGGPAKAPALGSGAHPGRLRGLGMPAAGAGLGAVPEKLSSERGEGPAERRQLSLAWPRCGLMRSCGGAGPARSGIGCRPKMVR